MNAARLRSGDFVGADRASARDAPVVNAPFNGSDGADGFDGDGFDGADVGAAGGRDARAARRDPRDPRDDNDAFARFLTDSAQKKAGSDDAAPRHGAEAAIVTVLAHDLAARSLALAAAQQARQPRPPLSTHTSPHGEVTETSKPRHLIDAVLREIESERAESDDATAGDASFAAAAHVVGASAGHVVGADAATAATVVGADPSAALETALQLLDDPAARASLDQRNAVVVVDDLRLRVTTRDGQAAVVVEGKKSAAVLEQGAELSRSLAQQGVAMTRLTAAGAAADSNNDRHGAAVVDTDDHAADKPGDGDDHFADFFVSA